VEDALQTRGIIYLNVETSLLFTPPPSKFLATCLGRTQSLKSNHQTTDVVKHLCSHPYHFMDFKNPEILALAFNHRELFIKQTLLIQEQHPRIM